MLFTLQDYLRCRWRVGLYSRYSRIGIMGLAFAGRLPDEVVARLGAGDIIAVSTYDSFLSWCVMYLTWADISHLAMYVKDGIVMHATLGGVKKAKTELRYGHERRLLPVHWPAQTIKHEQFLELVRSIEGLSYSWGSVVLKATRIVSGRDIPYFRYTFAIDLAICVGIPCSELWCSGLTVPIRWLSVPVYLIFAIVIGARGKKTYKDLFKSAIIVQTEAIPHNLQKWEVDKRAVLVQKCRVMRHRPRFKVCLPASG